MSEPSARSPKRRRPWAIVLVLVVLAAAAGVIRYRPFLQPTPAQLLARAAQARAKLVEIAFILQAPWPQANPQASGLPGARALLGPVEGQRSWRVLWHRDLGARAEVLAPTDISGTLTVSSPGGSWVYSPLLQVAMSGPPPSSASPLYLDELVALAATSAQARLLGRTDVAGRDAYELSATVALAPATELRLALDRQTFLPLRAGLYDANGRLLGQMEISNLDLEPRASADDFGFIPPGGTRVLGSGPVQALPDLQSAASLLPFVPQTPSYLPAGFALRAVNLFGQDEQLALVLTYMPTDGGATGLLSLTQTIAGPAYQPLPYGTPQQQGGWQGRQFELGELRGVDWQSGTLALTLFGTVAYAELIRVAASVR